jgi:hypothetical protein
MITSNSSEDTFDGETGGGMTSVACPDLTGDLGPALGGDEWVHVRQFLN